jgi:hypothetical protein
VQQVVEDEVTADSTGRIDRVKVAGEEVNNVAALQEPEDDEVYVDNDGVHGEAAGPKPILAPDGASVVDAIVGAVQDVVDGGGDGQQPGEDGQHLVGDDSALAVRVSLRERVDWKTYEGSVSVHHYSGPSHETLADGSEESTHYDSDGRTYWQPQWVLEGRKEYVECWASLCDEE